MRHVLHVIETLGHGGAEHQLCDIVTALDRTRFRSSVVHLHPRNTLAPRLESQGIRVSTTGVPEHDKRYWPLALARLEREARRLRPDLIHTSLLGADLLGGLVGRSLGVPVVSTLCNMGGEPEHLIDNPRISWFKLRTQTEVWGLALRRLHVHSVAISKAVKESAVRTYGLDPARVSVIYRAFREKPSTVDRLELRASLGLRPEEPVLLQVGRLVPQKGQRYLVEAMARVRQRHPSARLLIVGTGWLDTALAEQVRALGLEAEVRLLGRRDDVPALMRMADVFVFPSLFEGLGVSLVEASGLGLPCVASRVGPLPEVIVDGETGLLVPPRDPDALGRAIGELLDDPTRARRMGAAGRERIRAEFSLGKIVGAFEALYDRILGGGARAEDAPARRAPAL